MKIKYFSLVAFFALLLAACTPSTSTSETSEMEDTTQTDQLPVENDAMGTEADSMMGEGNVTKLTIDSFMFGYSEMEILGSPGETFEITLTSSGGMHDFDIDELGVDSEVIDEGETSTITFTIPEDAEPGTEYLYYCSVGEHRANGMEGKLIVQ